MTVSKKNILKEDKVFQALSDNNELLLKVVKDTSSQIGPNLLGHTKLTVLFKPLKIVFHSVVF